MLHLKSSWRFVMSAALCCSVLATGARRASADETKAADFYQTVNIVPRTSELVRHVSTFHEQTWWSDTDGNDLGVVHRSSWKQLFRSHYVFKGVHGEKRSEAAQPWSWGVLIPSWAQLNITDGNGNVLVHLKGSMCAAASKCYRITDARDLYLGDIRVDHSGESVAFSYPGQETRRFGNLVRETNGTSTGRWRLRVADAAVLPADVWPILGAYFSHGSDNSRANQEAFKGLVDGYFERQREEARWEDLANKLGNRIDARDNRNYR